MKKILLLSLMMASMMLSAQNTIYVNTTGSDTNDGLTVGTPVQTFSKAISMVTATTTEVVLAAGTYQEAAVASIPGACPSLTIKGENAANTIIIAAPTKRILTNSTLHQKSNNSLTIQDLTFKGASVSAGSGGAVNYQQSAGFKNDLTLERVIFEGNTVTTANTAFQFGGALLFAGNNMTINHCYFKNNTALVGSGTSGNGLISGGGAININNTIGVGTAPDVVYHTGVFVNINNSTFEGNTGATRGGAISVGNTFGKDVKAPNSYVKCTNCTFINNMATKNPVTSTTANNATGSAFSAAVGTAATAMMYDFAFTNCTFTGNKGGSADGSATVFESKAVLDLDGSQWATATLVNNIINVSATANCGAALYSNTATGGIKYSGSNNIIESVNALITDPSFYTAGANATNLNTTLTNNSTASVFAVPYLELLAGSSAIDAGTNNFGTPEIVPNSDVRGFIFAGSNKDCGAYEYGGIILPINPVRLDNSVSVYPNPVRSTLFVNSNAVTSFEVYSVNGNKVASYGTAQKSIDVSSLSAGMYLLQFKTGRGTIVKTFIKK